MDLLTSERSRGVVVTRVSLEVEHDETLYLRQLWFWLLAPPLLWTAGWLGRISTG